MDEEEVTASKRAMGNEQTLRVALAFSGLLGVVWLVVMEASPVARVAAGAVSILAIFVLAWNHRRKAGDASRESEVLAERLVEQNRQLSDDLTQVKDRHKLLDHYFETLMEHIPANIYFKDLKSRFMMMNKASATWQGYNTKMQSARPISITTRRPMPIACSRLSGG